MNITIAPLITSPVTTEIVERKGLGHPDTLCDALAEQFSLALSRFYLDRFGFILHHNVDKGLLWGGAARPAFGGGEVLQPMEIFLTGRATCEFRGVKIPVEELAIEASRRWLKEHLHALDPERHVRIHTLIRRSSPDLIELFLRGQKTGAVLANDTSCGVGYAPLDTLERTVLQVERHLNSPAIKAAHPELGEDIKVMGTRQGDSIILTIACALIDRHVASLTDYLAKKVRLRELALAAARQASDARVAVEVNTADGDNEESIYLTVTGTSAEAGDDGQVGRGNRVNGLIAFYRPMSMEAAAGKNPISHVGKLYNVAAHRIAHAVASEVAGVQEVYCYLVSQIGRPIQEPQIADLHVRVKEGCALHEIRPYIAEIAQAHLSTVDTLWRDLLAGEQTIF
ncbi:MAG: methionine adenosyltransferase [Gammaproteobacteria bacterium]|nr:methionine adenosyltransferase [Gammaproteobacteria bacterium]